MLPRLAHRHGLSASEIDDPVDALSIQADVIEPATGSAPDQRHPKDQDVLGTLLAALQTSAADYPITGDKDLLALADLHPILTPADSGRSLVGCEEGVGRELVGIADKCESCEPGRGCCEARPDQRAAGGVLSAR